MEKFLKIDAKLRRNKNNTGFALVLFLNDGLLDKCKELKMIGDV
jgi:hypothetical protein